MLHQNGKGPKRPGGCRGFRDLGLDFDLDLEDAFFDLLLSCLVLLVLRRDALEEDFRIRFCTT
jgi:hypothetical protein